jgi:hypothetical protein
LLDAAKEIFNHHLVGVRSMLEGFTWSRQLKPHAGRRLSVFVNNLLDH